MSLRIAALLGLAALAGCASAPVAAPASPAPAEPEAAPEKLAPPEAAPDPAEPTRPKVDFSQVEPAPPPAKLPALRIAAPARDQIIPTSKAATFAVKLEVKGLAPAPGGDHLCVSIDRHPCRPVTDLRAPLVLRDLDPTVDEGQHVITVLARRGSGEWLKPVGKSAAFASSSFYVSKRGKPAWKDGGPMLLLSVPPDGPAPAEGLLVDAYLANAELSAGYRIHATLTGPGLEAGVGSSIDSLHPFRLKNPRAGEYTAHFTLVRFAPTRLDSRSATEVTYAAQPVKGFFSEATRSFRVTER